MKVFAFWQKWSMKQKLAATLLLFGLVALFAGDPYSSAKTSINAEELALMIDKQVDHVSAAELADWIIRGKADYRLIDLRTDKEFAEYAIPTAENVPLSGLAASDLQRNEKIILYSEGGIHSAQAWFLLKARGYKSVYMLFGGLDEWKEQILFPRLPENPSPEQAQAFAKIRQVSNYFGGTPQTGAVEAAATVPRTMPKLTMPAGVGKADRPQGKKKKEGC